MTDIFKPRIPLEDEDCEALVRWMSLKRLRFGHIANENKAESRRVAAIRGAKRYRMGVRKGVPDYVIVIPAGANRPQRLLFLEMKRKKSVPSDVSPEQREWLADLGACAGVTALVAKGYDEAVAIIERELKSQSQPA